MKHIGAHVSVSGGVENAPLNAEALGADAFALFLKNQRQWKAKPLTDDSVNVFNAHCERCSFVPEYILPHVGYLINPGNPDPAKREKSRHALIDEIRRCEKLGLTGLNLHPGSHLGKCSEEECLEIIAEEINLALAETADVAIVLENTAGQGNCVGYRFEHLAAVIAQIGDKSRIGVCLDTCHAFAAGYDLRTSGAYKKAMTDFDKIIGYSYLRGMHLNDALRDLGSRVDRHASLGEGKLGMETFRLIVNDPELDAVPLILETPDESRWRKEIETLRSL